MPHVFVSLHQLLAGVIDVSDDVAVVGQGGTLFVLAYCEKGRYNLVPALFDEVNVLELPLSIDLDHRFPERLFDLVSTDVNVFP